MKTIEKYNEIANRLVDIGTSLQNFYREERALREQQNTLVGALIMEEKLLNETPWVLNIANSGDMWLYGGEDCGLKAGLGTRPKLCKVIGSTNWGSFDFACPELNIRVYADDGDASLSFLDASKAIETIKKLGIDVDFSVVAEKVKEAEALAKLYTDSMQLITNKPQISNRMVMMVGGWQGETYEDMEVGEVRVGESDGDAIARAFEKYGEDEEFYITERDER